MGSNNNSHRSPKASQRLRELLADSNRIVVAPGVYEGISARIALSLGFDALYMVCDKSLIHTALHDPFLKNSSNHSMCVRLVQGRQCPA